MTPDETKLATAQIALCDKRQKLIEAGKLKTLEPFPGDTVPGVPLVASDTCPSCGGTMKWYQTRKAFLCNYCQ